MKSKIKSLTILLAIVISAALFTRQASAQTSVSFQVFYDQLSPYGQWVDYPNYGYVWIPDAGPDFVPYSSAGHWIMTDYGWTWMSDYDWGWAPFHYGRWDYDNYYGWLWVPDNEWGPSWVTWRRANGYYGWEPMEPGISVNVSFGREYRPDNDHWIFVRDRDIERPDINRYYVDRTVHNRIVVNSTVINNTYIDNSRHTTYVSGPARNEVQKVTGRKINPVAVRENNKPGQNLSNGRLNIYRPQVVRNSENDHKSAPSRITNLKDIKAPAQRSGGTPGQKANQPAKQQPSQQNRNVNQGKQQSSPQQRNVQPAKQQPAKQQRNVQPSKQQRNVQPSKQQQSQPQRNVQPAKQQQSQPQRNVQPTKQQPQRNVQPSKQQQSQPQRNVQPAKEQQQRNMQPPVKEQQSQPQQNVQPSKQQPAQQQRNVQPAKQQQSQPRRTNATKKTGRENQPKQDNPPPRDVVE